MNVLVRTWNELDCKVDFLLNLLENINKADELVRLFFRNVRGIACINITATRSYWKMDKILYLNTPSAWLLQHLRENKK